jgi:hypothetical protein
VSSCQRLSSGCLGLSAPQACPSGDVCSGGACAGQCTNQCAVGAKRCGGSGVELCSLQPSGCTDWGAPTSCGGGQSCADGGCPGCTDACTAGTTSCVSSGSQQTCQLGPSGCLQWVTQACSANQQCVQGRCTAIPVCTTCPPGYACDGGVCAGGDSTQIQLNIPVVTVSGTLTVNGAPPSVVAGCVPPSALLTLTEVTSGTTATLSAGCDANLSFSGALLAGHYKVTVTGDDSHVNVPAQPYLALANLDLSASQAGLVLDIPVVTATGTVTVNGAPPAVAAGCVPPAALLTFTDVASGSTATLSAGCDAHLSFSGPLLGGTYKVTVKGDDSHVNVPAQPYLEGATVSLSTSQSGLNFDVPVVTVGGTLTVNGAAPSVAAGCVPPAALVTFTDAHSGSSVTLSAGCDANLSFQGPVLGGTYQVTLKGDDSHVNVPAQTYLATSSLSLATSQTGLVFDVPVVTAAGTVTVNGAAPAVAAGCVPPAALLTFTEATSGSTATLSAGCDANLSFQGPLLGGTYKVTLKGDDSHVNVPAQPYLEGAALDLSASRSSLVFDVPVVTVSGSLTVNRVAPIIAAGCVPPSALLTFSETTSGSTVSLSSTCAAGLPFSGPILAGTYQVTVKGDDSHVNVPAQPYSAAAALNLSTSQSGVVFDIPVYQVSGTLTVNGAPPAIAAGCVPPAALITFTDIYSGSSVTLSSSCAAGLPFSGAVLGGTYRITVAGDDSHVNVPAQPYLAVPALRIGP